MELKVKELRITNFIQDILKYNVKELYCDCETHIKTPDGEPFKEEYYKQYNIDKKVPFATVMEKRYTKETKDRFTGEIREQVYKSKIITEQYITQYAFIRRGCVYYTFAKNDATFYKLFEKEARTYKGSKNYTKWKEKFDKQTSSKPEKRRHIKMCYHNGTQFDNHFVLDELSNGLGYTVRNKKQKNLRTNNTINVAKKHTNRSVEVAYIKSKANLQLDIYQKRHSFSLVDTRLKTSESLKKGGKRLKEKGLIDKEYLKTDYDYQKYDGWDRDLAYKELMNNEEEKIYCRNDVVILALIAHYYDQIYYGFDFSKMTMSQNIFMEYRETSVLSNFVLSNQIKDYPFEGERFHLKYTDFEFGGENLMSFYHHFYKGGLNFYNPKTIGQHIKSGVFHIDINSSYPNSMASRQVPSDVKEFSTTPTTKKINRLSTQFGLYEISKLEFNEILERVPSDLVKSMFIKYYNNPSTSIYLTHESFKTLLMFIKGDKTFPVNVLKYIRFNTIENPIKEKILELYEIKNNSSEEEKAVAKLLLNGIYGLPALRPFFRYYVLDKDGHFQQLSFDGFDYKNTERNMLFSLFVTSASFHNLLKPLECLTPFEIDNYLYYGDTDSLFIDRCVMEKVQKNNHFHKSDLGAWDVEHENITDLYVLNHKKYILYSEDKKKVEIRAGGVPEEAFIYEVDGEKLPIEEIVKNQFSEGCSIKNNRSIINENKTVTILPSFTDLDVGRPYQTKFDIFREVIGITAIKEDIKRHLEKDNSTEIGDSAIYYETPFGAMSESEIYDLHQSHNTKNLKPFEHYTEVITRIYKDLC